MDINKISPRLQLALRYEALLSASAKALFQTAEDPNRWQIIVTYTGDIDHYIEELEMEVVRVGSRFLMATMPKENIGTLSTSVQVIELSLPVELSYTDIGLSSICMSNIGLPASQFNVTGRGVLVAVIDTGINYSYMDFLNPDNTTRIKYIWDQTIEGNIPEGFNRGAEYTEEEINRALSSESREEQLQIVPSEDVDGHGTALASIAAGNGRGSNGANKGVAIESELIVVKIGNYISGSSRPTNGDVMEGIAYVLNKAEVLNMPISIVLGIGDSLTGHDGLTPLESYIDEVSYTDVCNITVGAGNEANKGRHVSGQFVEGVTETLQFIMQGDEKSYGCCLWKEFIDEIEIVVQAPNGERTEPLSRRTPNRAYLFDNTAVLVNIFEPVTDITRQEAFIWFQAQGTANINKGQWNFIITPRSILNGQYNMWAQITNSGSRFFNPTIEETITSPGAARSVTAAGAFNASTTQIAVFSGRGYTADNRVKPAFVAPGINIPVANKDSSTGYVDFTGTSAAAAFVAGAYALLLQYGLFVLNQSNFYGQRLKAYLIRTANRPTSYGPYPNNTWGYGSICVEAALSYMLDLANTST